MNDLWFYDVNAHRWVCLYPGIEVKTIAGRIKDRELTLNADGLLVEKDGQPLPPLLIHAYGYLGYDPDRRKFAFFGSQFGNYFTTGKGAVFEEANRLFQEQRKGKKYPPLSPFFYDVASGKIECFAVDNAPKGQPYGANVLVYVTSKKQFFYGGSDGVWFLDRDKRTWVDAKPKGPPPAGIDHCAAYDPKRDRVYYHQRDGKTAADNFLVYDVKANAWSRPKPKGTGPAVRVVLRVRLQLRHGRRPTGGDPAVHIEGRARAIAAASTPTTRRRTPGPTRCRCRPTWPKASATATPGSTTRS